LAIADTSVVQAIEAEGVHVWELGQNLGEHIDEEVAIGSQQAEHAAMRVLLHIDRGDFGRIRRDTTPIRMAFVDFALKAWRIDSENANAKALVLGDVFV